MSSSYVYTDSPPRFGPIEIWRASIWLHRHRCFRLAKVLKAVNFFVFRAILPPEAEIGRDLRWEHYAMNAGCHPNTSIGDRVRISQDVQLGSMAEVGGPDRIVVEDDVIIGMGARIVNSPGHTLTIGRGSHIGACALITRDVPPFSKVRAAPGTVIPPAQQPTDLGTHRAAPGHSGHATAGESDSPIAV